MANLDSFLFNSLVMHISQGLLAGQGTDRRYIDHPNKKKEEILADDAFKFACEIYKRLKEREEMAAKPD